MIYLQLAKMANNFTSLLNRHSSGITIQIQAIVVSVVIASVVTEQSKKRNAYYNQQPTAN